MTTLAKVNEVDIKQIFKNTAQVTQWLLENRNQLEELIDTELTNINQPSKIYKDARPDIIAEETFTDNKIVILINLDKPAGEDLTRFLACAAGSNANKAVWIVTNIDDKTRYIIDWLNKRTSWKSQFILIKLSAYTIRDSLPAVNLIKVLVFH